MQALVGNGDCPGVTVPSPSLLMAAGKQSQFTSASEAMAAHGLSYLNGATEAQGKDSVKEGFDRLIADNCRSNALRWMQQLAPVTIAPPPWKRLSFHG